MEDRPRTGVWWLVACVALATQTSCVDIASECGPNMRYEPALGECVCADGAVADGGGCHVCASDEIVVGSACGCAPGEIKNPDGVCAPVPGLGTGCDAASPCTDSTYGYCAVRDAVGSCTKQCAVDADCPAAYVCADWEPVPSCRTYTGYGATCMTPVDCAGFDAMDCVQGHCVVNGCTVGIDECPRATACCDLSSFGLGTLCIPAGSCT